jgi:hypothetical protein
VKILLEERKRHRPSGEDEIVGGPAKSRRFGKNRDGHGTAGPVRLDLGSEIEAGIDRAL